MTDKRKTFWPYGIVLSIVACVAACVATIVISLDYPVQMDSFYMEKYQNVDENINEIQGEQRRFEAKYDVKFKDLRPKIDSQVDFEFIIIPKNDAPQNFDAKALLTRPQTNEFNKELKASFQGGILKTQQISLPKEGRWQILLKLNDGENVGFYKFDFNATR